ncbi:unnamed protein product [Lactuca virosa]|uniref:3-oxoacyl-[acyl-carrier-protein] synthase n=1 Tax=Lactuca virosa TaxID=75947 RepID=A0AAU9NT77_9ASTR|nr:unnamed protein product [Lactuca virosa]
MLPKNSSSIIVKSPARLSRTFPHVLLASQASAPAPKREKDAKKRVVITGMGLVSVFGNDVDTYYDRLLAGESGISLIDKFDASIFPTRFGGQIRGFKSDGYIDAKSDSKLDDSQRYCLVAGKTALEDAGLGSHELLKIDKERAGVVVGSGAGGVTVFSDAAKSLMEKADNIRLGKADLMIAGGVDAPLIPLVFGGFVACSALSRRNHDHQTASRPWDKQRDGFVMSEGAGVLVMESLEHAMKRGAPILAEYLGGAVNCDAYHITNPRPDGFSVSSCIQSSLVDAGVSAEEVNYINAHATSTLIGDIAEVNALKKVFKNTKGIKMNATKSMIGHSMGASGGLEAIATIKAIQTGWLHPTINQFNPEPRVEFDTVANQKQQHEINVAISNSFGFGGQNSVIAFSAFKP